MSSFRETRRREAPEPQVERNPYFNLEAEAAGDAEQGTPAARSEPGEASTDGDARWQDPQPVSENHLLYHR